MKNISATVKVTSCNIQKIKYIFAPEFRKKISAATFAPCFLQHSSISIGRILQHPKTVIVTSISTMRYLLQHQRNSTATTQDSYCNTWPPAGSAASPPTAGRCPQPAARCTAGELHPRYGKLCPSPPCELRQRAPPAGAHSWPPPAARSSPCRRRAPP